MHLVSRIMTCTPVQFIFRLPMMFVFHQLLRVVDTIYLPSLVLSIMGASYHIYIIIYIYQHTSVR
jgi:hypothetical protein